VDALDIHPPRRSVPGPRAWEDRRMLESIRTFLERQFAAPDSRSDARTIQLATAALLAETMRIDGEITQVERDIACDAIRERLGLSQQEAGELLEHARDEVRRATDYFQFTSQINRHFTQEQKIRVIELMWRVAYADARIDDHELHLLRRIADLLHVPHPDFIAAKLRAQKPSIR
jgi:uncharacterized tellurite resistance protein B-like protein